MITTQCLPTAPAVYEEVLCLYFHHPATPEISTLSLHDALPISVGNPHAVVEGDPDDLPLIGPLLETHPRYPNRTDRKSTRLNSSHANISYAVFCLKKKNNEGLQLHPQPGHRPGHSSAAHALSSL